MFDLCLLRKIDEEGSRSQPSAPRGFPYFLSFWGWGRPQKFIVNTKARRKGWVEEELSGGGGWVWGIPYFSLFIRIRGPSTFTHPYFPLFIWLWECHSIGMWRSPFKGKGFWPQHIHQEDQWENWGQKLLLQVFPSSMSGSFRKWGWGRGRRRLKSCHIWILSSVKEFIIREDNYTLK